MAWDTVALFMLLGMTVALLIGQWTAFALGAIGLLMLLVGKGWLGLVLINSVVWNTSNSYILIAVPMFLLMGEVILRSGVSRYFYRGVIAVLGGLPGGLLHANIASCAIFSAVSGSSVATAATVGTVAIPEMLSRGYDRRLLFGSLAAGGTLGILIPPSIVMVLYGALVEESIARLFIAGIVPGIVMSGFFMIYIAVRLVMNPKLAPPRSLETVSARERFVHILHVVPIVTLLLAVLGGIYTGFATPTEASAVGAAGAIVLAACYGGLNRTMFREALLSTVRTTCMVTLIIVGAQILSTALSYLGVSRGISDWMSDLGLSKWVLYLALIALYVVLGCFVDGISMIYITLPVLFPVVKAAGFDPVWFGVVLTILIELGQITPPVGLNLFTIHAISGGHSFTEVVAGSTPFVFIMLLLLFLLAVEPGLALWLPAMMQGG